MEAQIEDLSKVNETGSYYPKPSDIDYEKLKIEIKVREDIPYIEVHFKFNSGNILDSGLIFPKEHFYKVITDQNSPISQ